MPVRFDCHDCAQPWWSPPANGCPRCGYWARATPDPIVWTVGRVPGTRIFVTGQMRAPERFRELVARGVRTFVDAAGDASYVWRPDKPEIAEAGVDYVRIPIEDTNVDLPDNAFSVARDAIEASEGDALLFCAAGLKRAPALLYGVLRHRGHARGDAWALVSAARPMTEPFAPYINAAERWLESR